MARIKQFTVVQYVVRWCIDFLRQSLLVQSVATLVALPITVGWGFGLSYATLIGNICGVPLLALFLLGSSLLWGAALIGFDCPLVARALCLLVFLCQRLLQAGSADWLVYAPRPPLLVLCLLGAAIICFLWVTRCYPLWRRVSMNTASIVAIILLLQIYGKVCLRDPHVLSLQLPTLAIGYQPEGILLGDHGFANRAKRPEQMIEYTLRSFLVTRYGTVNIAVYTVHRVCRSSMLAAAALCATCKVAVVRLPFFSSLSSPSGWRAYFDLVRVCHERGTRLERFVLSPTRAKRQADMALGAYLKESDVPQYTTEAQHPIVPSVALVRTRC